jgi:hypothetical protein
MSSFPAISPLIARIGEKIQNTDKETFSGSKPFINLTKFANGTKSINYGSYTSFNLSQVQNYNERFPPIITGLEVGNSGTLGAIRKSKIHVKFASINQMTEYKDFLLIGNTQMVSWGWINQKTKFTGNTAEIAASIVTNIKNWETQVAAYDYDVDMMAGPLVNFDFKINDDATIDCTLELGSPGEIPGFLALNKKEKKTSTEAKTDSDNLVNVYQALNLDGEGTGTDEDEVKLNTINFKDDKIDKVSTWGETDNVYVQLGFALNAIVNKFREKSESKTDVQLTLDLEDAIAMAHPNMISVSENIVFPNSDTMGFLDGTADDNSRVLTPDIANVQKFGPFNGTHEFPQQEVSVSIGGTPLSITGKKAGYIKNIYVYTEFLKNSMKGCESVNDFVDKIISELNVAGAGLYNLVRREVGNKDGKLVYTIVDLNLAQDKVNVTKFSIFTQHSRVTNVNMNCDLPKEIVAMMAIPSDDPAQHDDNPGIRMFKKVTPDPIMVLANKIPKPKVGKPASGEDSAGFLTKAMNWLSTSWTQAFNLPGENRIKFAKSNKFGDNANPIFGVFKDVSCVKTIYFPKGYERRHALVPISVSFTILGLSGVTIGSALKLTPSPVPWLQDSGYWQVTSVEHKVDDTKWETTIECKFRVSTEVK